MQSYKEVLKELMGGDPTPLPEEIISAQKYNEAKKKQERKQLRDSWKKKKQYPR